MPDHDWLSARRPRLLLFRVLAGLLVVVAVVVLVKFVPPWIASTDGLVGEDRAEEIGRSRTAFLAVLAGALASIGAIFTGLSYRLNRQAHELDRAGQITERFTRAIDQLGSQTLDIRLGGIYALERIARDSAEDHPQVVEVLTAFIREHARVNTVPSGKQATPGSDPRPGDVPLPTESPQDHPTTQVAPPTDILAAMSVLGRRQVEHDRAGFRLNLMNTDLRNVGLSPDESNFERADLSGSQLQRGTLTEWNLNGANLEGTSLARATLRGAQLNGASLGDAELVEADLSDARLAGTRLSRANLSGAYMHGANLRDANLEWATLTKAHLDGAHLQRAVLRKADLIGASCGGADLRGADLLAASLMGAHLERADLRDVELRGADLRGAYVEGARFEAARFNESTTWPAGFDIASSGARRTDNEPA